MLTSEQTSKHNSNKIVFIQRSPTVISEHIQKFMICSFRKPHS